MEKESDVDSNKIYTFEELAEGFCALSESKEHQNDWLNIFNYLDFSFHLIKPQVASISPDYICDYVQLILRGTAKQILDMGEIYDVNEWITVTVKNIVWIIKQTKHNNPLWSHKNFIDANYLYNTLSEKFVKEQVQHSIETCFIPLLKALFYGKIPPITMFISFNHIISCAVKSLMHKSPDKQ